VLDIRERLTDEDENDDSYRRGRRGRNPRGGDRRNPDAQVSGETNMTDTNDTLAATMKRIDANERTFRLGLFAAAAIEAAALGAFLLLTDFRDRTQVLLLLALEIVFRSWLITTIV
jgi:hypothetical protein